MQLLLLFLLILTTSLSADWDPKSISEIDPQCLPLEYLQNHKFVSLKKKMKLYLKHTWTSEEKTNLISDLIFLTNPQTCVEIGVFTGSSILPIAATVKLLGDGTVYGIDPWSTEECVKNIDPNDSNYKWWSDLDMPNIKKRYYQMVNSWSLENTCRTIISTSEKAVDQFDSIDFLHMDGNFSEIGSLLDAQLYLPKVKSGGYILLSNMFISISGKPTKLKTLWALCDECDVICEIDDSNTVLFRKR